MDNEADRQTLQEAYRLRYYPNDDQAAFRGYVQLEVQTLQVA